MKKIKFIHFRFFHKFKEITAHRCQILSVWRSTHCLKKFLCLELQETSTTWRLLSIKSTQAASVLTRITHKAPPTTTWMPLRSWATFALFRKVHSKNTTSLIKTCKKRWVLPRKDPNWIKQLQIHSAGSSQVVHNR